MSDVENPTAGETDDATEEAAPVTIETVDLSSFDDETRIQDGTEDGSTFRSFLSDWMAKAKAAVRETNRYTNAAKALAEARVTARSFMLLKSGFPDWAGDSDAYRRSVTVAESQIMATLDRDAKSRLDASVRQHVKRNYMLPGVVGFIVTTEANFADEAAIFATDPAKVLSAPSDRLKSRVRAHYRAAKLTLPDGPFQDGSVGGTGGPGNTDEPQNVLASLKDALGGLTQIVPRLSTAAVHQTLTLICQKLIDGKINEVEGRPKVVAQLQRIAIMANETAKAVNGDQYAEDALKTAYFDPKRDAAE